MSTADSTSVRDTATASDGPVGRSPAADWAHRPVSGPRLSGGLMHDWQQRNVNVSLPLALRQLQTAGNLDNMRLAVRAGDAPLGDGDRAAAGLGVGPVQALPGTGYRGPVFMDSDIYKTLEAIGWELGHGQHQELAGFASDVIGLLARAQRGDGYLNSYFQISGEPRYERLAWSHEMYCAGHLIQAAVAMHRGGGDERLLAIATSLADHLVREFAGRERGLDGHPVIETALAELYRQTGRAEYLELASQFIEQRGSGLAGDSGMGRRYLLDHLPVRSSPTQVGHVVRALYLEAGIADVAAETGDRELLQASVRRWEDMVATKTYLTGGNGSRHSDEGFGDRFELPPDRAYNETCAAIAAFQWSWRLLLATGQARYADHMERVLFNGFAAAISTSGDRFFYVNPLQRRADHFEKDDPGRRRAWFSCACCPPNIMRLLASLEHYLATTSGEVLYLQQYAGATVGGAGLRVEMQTGYPWSGTVRVRVLSADPGERGLAFRAPAWSAATRLTRPEAPRPEVPRPEATRPEASRLEAPRPEAPRPEALRPENGYITIRREWRAGDEVTIEFDMAPRWVYPDRRVDAVRGCVALERGPLVYCFEQADQPDGLPVDDLELIAGAGITERATALEGIGPTVELTVPARFGAAGDNEPPVRAVAIPYFQWDNRDARPMRVWMPNA